MLPKARYSMDKSIFVSPVPPAGLTDESGLCGHAEGLARPATAAEAAAAVKEAARLGKALTVQGARTGLCGGALPNGGLLLDTGCLTGLTGFYFDENTGAGWVEALAGTTLESLQLALDTKTLPNTLPAESEAMWQAYQNSRCRLRLPADPSEPTATLGGLVATAAGGARGTMEDCLLAAETVLPGGGMALFALPGHMDAFAAGQNIPPARLAGEPALLPGSEGKAGAITRVRLRLQQAPAAECGLLAFFDTPGAALACHTLMQTADERGQTQGARLFAPGCFAFLAANRGLVPGFAALPEFSGPPAWGLWLEAALPDDDALMNWLGFALDALEKTGGNPDSALAAAERRDFLRLQAFGHALTEACNQLCRGGMPFLWDITPPAGQLAPTLEMLAALPGSEAYPAMLTALPGQNLAQLRLLPAGEARPGPEGPQAAAWMKQLRAAGCRCAPRHGIGRVKRPLLLALGE